MVVGYQPGGTIKDARIILAEGETLPNSFNTALTVVWRRSQSTDWQLLLLKDVGEILPGDDPLLSELPGYLPLTTTEKESSMYEHADIIAIDEDSFSDNGDTSNGGSDLVPDGRDV
ncbi:Uncharacterised protein [uncultured archaeon]|nr:Uncharacterised protein [uncultured archaeon]